jgi:hypothetical protein
MSALQRALACSRVSMAACVSKAFVPYVSIRQHTSAYVSILQHTSAYVSIRQHTLAYVSIRQHTSAYVSIRQHTSAYISCPHVSDYRDVITRRKRAYLFIAFKERLPVHCDRALISQRRLTKAGGQTVPQAAEQGAPAAPSASVFVLLYQ